MKSAPTLLTIAIGLESEEGHQYAYNKAVGKAAALIGWKHVAAVSSTCQIEPLPPGWSACLDRGTYRFSGNPFPKLNSVLRLARSIAKTIKAEQAASANPLIVFLEFFNEVQLLSLAVALLSVPRHALRLWLLYRTRSNWSWWRRYAHRMLFRFFELMLSRNRVGLLTDSEILATSLAQEFGRQAHVMPIPHTDVAQVGGAATSIVPLQGKLAAWWPGLPRSTKGLAVIQRLSRLQSVDAQQFHLIAARAAGLVPTPGGCQLTAIADVLTRAEYLQWLHAVDIILLPYDPKGYAEATSGIFVESVTAGKMPFVSAGTWMAQELLRHALPELLVDWGKPSPLPQIFQTFAEPAVQAKLKRMQASYLAYHSEAGFATALQGVFDEQSEPMQT